MTLFFTPTSPFHLGSLFLPLYCSTINLIILPPISYFYPYSLFLPQIPVFTPTPLFYPLANCCGPRPEPVLERERGTSPRKTGASLVDLIRVQERSTEHCFQPGASVQTTWLRLGIPTWNLQQNIIRDRSLNLLYLNP